MNRFKDTLRNNFDPRREALSEIERKRAAAQKFVDKLGEEFNYSEFDNIPPGQWVAMVSQIGRITMFRYNGLFPGKGALEPPENGIFYSMTINDGSAEPNEGYAFISGVDPGCWWTNMNIVGPVSTLRAVTKKKYVEKAEQATQTKLALRQKELADSNY